MTSGFDDPLLYFDLTYLYLHAGDSAKGYQILETGITIYPKNQRLALAMLDLNMITSQSAQVMEADLKRTSATFPNNEKIYVATGKSWGYMMKHYEENNEMYFGNAREAYLKALEINPNNFEANFHIGHLLYSHAVQIIGDQSYDLDLIVLNRILDRVNQLFREAVPYVERARQLAPDNKETLKALQGLYYNLNKTNEFEKVSKGLDN